jgi:hypothetical protein
LLLAHRLRFIDKSTLDRLRHLEQTRGPLRGLVQRLRLPPTSNLRIPTQHLRTIASCLMMRAMSGTARSTTTSSAICVISITETTMITVPAGPEGRD